SPKFGNVTINDGGKITGVTAGTAATDAANVGQVNEIGAVANKGWNIQTNGDTATNVAPGGTVQLNDGQNIKLTRDGSTVTVATADDLVASSLTAGNTLVNNNGVTLSGGSNGTVSLGNSGLNNGGNKITNVAAGTADTDAVNVSQLAAANGTVANKGMNFDGDSGETAHRNLGQTLNVKGGATGSLTDNNIAVVSNGSDTLNVQLAKDIDLGSEGSVTVGDTQLTNSGLTVGNTLVTTAGISNGNMVLASTGLTLSNGANGTVMLSNDGLDNGNNKITNVAAGTAATDAVNVSQLTNSNATVSRLGMNFAGDNGNIAHRSLGETLTVKGGAVDNLTDGNIGVVSNGTDSLSVQLAKDIDLSSEGSIKTGNTVVDNNGITISSSNGTISLTEAGLNNGGNKLTNIAAGTDANDAVNVSQLTSAISGVRTHYYGVNDGGVTGGNYNGEGATGNYAVVAGVSASATSSGATALGSSSQAQATGATAVGYQAQSTATGSVALGSNASDNGRGAETYTGAYSNAENVTVGTVSIGNAETGETRTLSNVADAKQATDAVNLRQLDGAVQTANNYTDTQVAKVNQQGSENANNISLLSNGKDGYFQVNNTDNYAKPTSSGENSSAGGSGAKASGSYSIALGTNATASSANSVALGSNSVADRENSVSVGSSGKERQITHVAAGTEDTDAVNVKQLKSSEKGSVRYASNQDGSTNYSQVTLGDGQTPTTLSNVAPGTSGTDAVNVNQMKQGLANANRYTDHAVGEVRKDAFSGVAAAIATANLPQSYVPGGSMTSVGLGSYQGQSALAVGVSTVSDNGRWVFKLSGTTSSRGDTGVGAGVGLQW
ncbi:YadA family autotransporter adhesin, partial [Rosenbergiella epipactidis]|uniref:YadA family autotransporter adhesin n=1 Tax=Rosenbergiella epipactidis TaxID=1544694 RepID=UPI0020260F67